jgi:ATP-binding cassette, subfamily D (ALD), peroxisomal long-chain fatty acid import protein
MAIFSKLRPSDTSIAQFASIYAAHRPLTQRFLTTGFVLYVLSTTYRGLAARPRKSSSEDRKGKERKHDDAKAPRVAVSSVNLNSSFVSSCYR